MSSHVAIAGERKNQSSVTKVVLLTEVHLAVVSVLAGERLDKCSVTHIASTADVLPLRASG